MNCYVNTFNCGLHISKCCFKKTTKIRGQLQIQSSSNILAHMNGGPPSKVNSLYHPLSHMDTYVCINIGPDTLNSSRMHLEQSLKNIILWYRSKPENKASYHIHLIMLHVKGTWNKTKHFLKWGQGHNHIKLYKPKLWFQFCHLLINIGKKKILHSFGFSKHETNGKN